ncbi:hypothetical protein DFH27DRAFT_117880 [Peziza echinospora]|nr:hypothetical protein DFH27DRAFT_117880 [Peziza echinospora]
MLHDDAFEISAFSFFFFTLYVSECLRVFFFLLIFKFNGHDPRVCCFSIIIILHLFIALMFDDTQHLIKATYLNLSRYS